MLITNLKKGESAIITSIDNSNSSYYEELTSLGLNEGCKITLCGQSIFGHLLHIKCNNSTFVLRKNTVHLIEVDQV